MARTATSSPTQQLSLLQTVVIVIAVWGLVSMPVTYTGGASLPHPHSLVQFLREAETGSMSHHRIQAAGSATGHTAMAHASPQQKPVDESVDHAPVISPPSFGVERVVLASVSQPALAARKTPGIRPVLRQE